MPLFLKYFFSNINSYNTITLHSSFTIHRGPSSWILIAFSLLLVIQIVWCVLLVGTTFYTKVSSNGSCGTRARICKRLRSPGIDSKKSIRKGCRTGPPDKAPYTFTNSGSVTDGLFVTRLNTLRTSSNVSLLNNFWSPISVKHNFTFPVAWPFQITYFSDALQEVTP